MKKTLEEFKDFFEVFTDQRCGSAQKRQQYLKAVFLLALGYFLGHSLGFFLFSLP